MADHITQTNPVYGLIVTFDGFTGLRAAEVAGLEIRDLTLSEIPGTAGAVRVDRTKTKDGSLWVTESTKTDESQRTVPLEPWLADDLRDYLRTHPRAAEPTAPLFPGRLTLTRSQGPGENCHRFRRPIRLG